MTQTRITLNSRIKPLADELLQLTGVDSFSNLFSLLITRYGYHLKNSWVIAPSMQPPSMMQTASCSSEQTPRHELPPSSEPVLLELPQTQDPVILRMARLIEEF